MQLTPRGRGWPLLLSPSLPLPSLLLPPLTLLLSLLLPLLQSLLLPLLAVGEEPLEQEPEPTRTGG